MGGTSKTEKTETQSATQNPWDPAQPLMRDMLGQLTGQLGKSGLSGAESGALDTITKNAGGVDQFMPQLRSFTGELLNGGGAGAQSGNVERDLADYKRRLGATADGKSIGKNSGLNPYLDTIRNDVTNQVNGMFAAGGRDFSGAHIGTLGKGIAAGQAPVIANQYNQDVASQRGAADALYGAGNATAGVLSGFNQQGLNNRMQGAGMVPGLMDAQNAGANSILQAESMRRGIPMQALQMIAQLGIPIAGLGGSSTGTATMKGTQKMSGADQFSKLVTPFTSMFKFGGG